MNTSESDKQGSGQWRHVPKIRPAPWKELSTPGDHWTWEPIPLGMKLRGYLPVWLKGEMVYEAVVRTGHFSNNHFLQTYLEDQATTAFIRGEREHYRRIVELIAKIPGYLDFV